MVPTAIFQKYLKCIRQLFSLKIKFNHRILSRYVSDTLQCYILGTGTSSILKYWSFIVFSNFIVKCIIFLDRRNCNSIENSYKQVKKSEFELRSRRST